jgi:hypothetical protein
MDDMNEHEQNARERSEMIDMDESVDPVVPEPEPEPPRPRLELTPQTVEGQPHVAIRSLDGLSPFSVEQTLSMALRDWRAGNRLPT